MDGGTEKISMKDNRRKAIINAALFRYYPNKLELVIAVCAC